MLIEDIRDINIYNYKSLTEFEKEFQKCKIDLINKGCKESELKVSISTVDCETLYIFGNRMETEEELSRRSLTEEMQKNFRREQYEKLRKEFEGE